jgi:hypothetical protein
MHPCSEKEETAEKKPQCGKLPILIQVEFQTSSGARTKFSAASRIPLCPHPVSQHPAIQNKPEPYFTVFILILTKKRR